MEKKNLKITFKYFIFIFLITFLMINWEDIFWIFDYRFIFAITSEVFGKTESKNIQLEEKKPISLDNGLLEIKTINVLAPIIFPKTLEIKELSKFLETGVVHFPNSALPGNPGQTVILGHSAPVGWPRIKYQWVFSEINKLKQGDEVILNFGEKKLVYFVEKRIFLEKGENIPQDLTKSKNMLILISCWPPGKNVKRIAVVASIKN